MAEQAIFKSQTFGGFNKEEVLKYIDKMSTEYSEEHEKSEAEISSLRTELEEKDIKLFQSENSLEELQAKYDEIMDAYEELRQHYLMLKEHSDNIDAENEKLSARLETAQKELEIQKELNAQLEDRIEEETHKAEIFVLKERKLNAAIDDAGESAKHILASAKTGAQSILADAQNKAESINSEIDDLRKELDKTKGFMEDSLAVLIQRLEYIGKSAEEARISEDVKAEKEIQIRYEALVSETDLKTRNLKERFFR